MKTASNHGVWHRIITFAVLFQCTIAWIQRGVRFQRQHCSPLAATLQRATWCSTAHQGARRGQGSKTVLFAQDGDSLDLYRTVAEQDPEWYREFVINVLGEDLPESAQSIDKPPQSTKPEETKRKKDDCTRTTLKPPSSSIGNQSDQVESPIQGVRDNETVATEDLLTIDESDGPSGSTSQPPSDSSEPQQQSTDIFRGPKADAVIPPNDVVEPSGIIRPINEPGTREKGSSSRPEETETVVSTTHRIPKSAMQSTKTIKPRRRTSLDEPSSISVKADSPAEADKRTTGEGRYEKLPTKSKTSLDTADKPRNSAGVISKEKSDRKSVTPKKMPASVEKNPSNGKPDTTLSNVKTDTLSQADKPKADNQNTRETTKAQSWFNVSMWKRDSKQVEQDSVSLENESEEATPLDTRIVSAQDNYVVLYRDLYTGDLRAENLTSVTNLGYTVNEIPYLQPDALALIVEDGIKKPARGIPQQWQISESQYEVLSDDVRIVPQEEAKELLEVTNGKKQNAREEKHRTPRSKMDAEVDNMDIGSGARQVLREKKHPARSEQERSPTSTARESRRRRRLDDDDPALTRDRRSRSRQKRKPIYSAYEVPKRSARSDDDPPPPDSPLWVDMDTFRELLRSEAALRVRILGEDWADIVKDESNWRLSLYKEWLWALNKGIGNPLVPSRSDRMRGRPQPRGTTSSKKRDNTKYRRRRRDEVKDATKSRNGPAPAAFSDASAVRERPGKRRRLETNTNNVEKVTSSRSDEMDRRNGRRSYRYDYTDAPRRADQREARQERTTYGDVSEDESERLSRGRTPRSEDGKNRR
jgi:hypothetical protein